jgi:Apea-like HEPN
MPKSSPSQLPRATVPLFFTDFQCAGRRSLTEDVTLAELTARESERVRSSHAYAVASLPSALFRLEILFDAEPKVEEEAALRLVTKALRLLACVSNALPVWLSLPVDRYSHEHKAWHRSTVADASGGVRLAQLWQRSAAAQSFFGDSQSPEHGDHWFVSEPQIAHWASLLKHWPTQAQEGRIAIALEYLVEAIRDLATDERRALLSASICLECLFGGDGGELRHRISTRVAHLLTTGADAAAVYARAKTWYDARSRFVHSGLSPAAGLTIEAIGHLRVAILAMARLIDAAGSHEAALQVLDRASFERPTQLDTLHGEPPDAWWRLPPCPPSG